MLYLIRTFGRSEKSRYLKVGFTDSVERRFRVYKTQNPFFESISIREGDEYTETLLHLYLTARGYKADFMVEWFIDCPGVLSEFHVSVDHMKRYIWKCRDQLFKPSDFTGRGDKLKERIYEDLRLQNKDKVMNCAIDKVWREESNKKIIKQLKRKEEDGDWLF